MLNFSNNGTTQIVWVLWMGKKPEDFIQKPEDSGRHFYNYKNRCSIVLLALVDANLKFLYIHVGTNGRVSDGGVFNKASLKKGIYSNYLKDQCS